MTPDETGAAVEEAILNAMGTPEKRENRRKRIGTGY